jgi:hypothetical protein
MKLSGKDERARDDGDDQRTRAALTIDAVRSTELSCQACGCAVRGLPVSLEHAGDGGLTSARAVKRAAAQRTEQFLNTPETNTTGIGCGTRH